MTSSVGSCSAAPEMMSSHVRAAWSRRNAFLSRDLKSSRVFVLCMMPRAIQFPFVVPLRESRVSLSQNQAKRLTR